MFDGRGGALIHLMLGGVFLVVAFGKRWRGVVGRVNPYSVELLMMLVTAAIGLVELYVGINQLAGGRWAAGG